MDLRNPLSRRGRDVDAQAVYAAEQRAFAGSFLAEHRGASALCEDTHAVMDSLWWTMTFGTRRCGVEPVQNNEPHSACLTLGGAVIEIRYAHTDERFTIAHELAHASTSIRRLSGPAHGHAFRTWYVALISVAFGEDWADRLIMEFTATGLSIGELPEV